MIITIATSGGIGGFGSGQPTTVDIDQLSPEVRQEACEAMTDERLAPLADQGDVGADRLTYTISITSDGKDRRYEIAESALPPEMLDLIDTLAAQD